MAALKRWLAGNPPEELRQARQDEITYLRHELKNTIQVVQSGNRLLENMSGAITINRHPRQRGTEQ